MTTSASVSGRAASPWLDFAPCDRSIQSIYIHVPFCAVKCHYCAFYSKEPDRQTIEDYVTALCAEIEAAGPSAGPRTIFFGGGTPSILPPVHLKRIFESIEKAGWSGAEEWTVECNPATLNPAKIRLFRDYGVNRISMGVQSMEPELLETLGRIHTVEMVHRSFDQLRDAGFDNINLDLMFAIPGQTMSHWNSSLQQIADMGSEHLSCYEVIYEEDTPLFQSLKDGTLSEADEELAEAMYEYLIDFLRERGFRQYEVANFARDRADDAMDIPLIPDFACRHNLNYWHGGSYLGLGPAANGFIRDIRYQNVANTRRYAELMGSTRNAMEWKEQLSPMARAGELAAFGFRTAHGWDAEQFRQRTGFNLTSQWEQPIRNFISCGWMSHKDGRFFLTPTGLRFADAVAMEFLVIG